jgi:hypothetical protein
MPAEHKPWFIVQPLFSLWIFLHWIEKLPGDRGCGLRRRLCTRDQIRDAAQSSTCHLATTTDEETGVGSTVTGTGIESAIERETVVEIGIEAEEIGIETPVEEAAPEVLEEERMIDVRVRVITFYFRSKSSLGQRGTGETIVTTTGGTLTDGREMIVEETTGGMNATVIEKILETETYQKTKRLSLPQDRERDQVSVERTPHPRCSLFTKCLWSLNQAYKSKI